MENFTFEDAESLISPRHYEYADFVYEKIMEEIAEFEKTLTEKQEVGVFLVGFAKETLMTVTDIGYQNPSLIYFYGNVKGCSSQLIQHVSQLNFLLTSIPVDTQRPPRRIGFVVEKENQ